VQAYASMPDYYKLHLLVGV